jgi:hypothetical protein
MNKLVDPQQNQGSKSLFKKWWFWLILLMVVAGSRYGSKTESVLSQSEPQEQEVEKNVVKSIPSPSGTYVDREAGLSFTFLGTGKFWQEVMGETSFGRWERIGKTAEITFDEGSTMTVQLGDGYVEFRGMRLEKR